MTEISPIDATLIPTSGAIGPASAGPQPAVQSTEQPAVIVSLADTASASQRKLPVANPDAHPNVSGANGLPEEDFIEALKRGVTRLSPEEKAQMLAEWPPPEEMERLYREMMERGGLSAEEFFESLGIPLKDQP